MIVAPLRVQQSVFNWRVSLSAHGALRAAGLPAVNPPSRQRRAADVMASCRGRAIKLVTRAPLQPRPPSLPVAGARRINQPGSPFNDGTQPLGSIFQPVPGARSVRWCVCVRLTRRPPERPGFMMGAINPEERGSPECHPTRISYFT